MRRDQGLSLIELVLALIIIGISSATIASLLVTSLNFAQTNQSYVSDLRDAEDCYETLLSVEENDEWSGNGPDVYGECLTSEPPRNVSKDDLSSWVRAPYYSTVFEVDGTREICTNKQITCQSLTLNGWNGTKFTIPIRGDNHIELVVPHE